MRVELKPWNKSRVGSVILFALLSLFFGSATLVVFFGDVQAPIWMYVFCPAITAVFAWALCITVSPKHLYCMDAVKGEMTFKELKESVEAEEYAEPLKFGPYLDEDGDLHETTYRMLISKSWMLLGQDMANPLCIPKANVVKVSGGRDVQEELGPGHPARDGYFLVLHLANGKKFVTGSFTAEHLGEAEKMVREHFPHAEYEGFPPAS